VVAWGGHAPAVQALETDYMRCLCFATMPFLLMSAINSFFAGRGATWPVLVVNAVGTVVNVVLDYAWIYGHWGFPAWGIVGAGAATVAGSWASALTALALFLRPRYRAEFHTLTGWRLDVALFRRLMRFGLPAGMQYCMEALAFTIFLMFVGQMGTGELTATSIAFTINIIALVPMVGLAQAVSVLVGQRLGQDRPELATMSTLRGVVGCLLYTALCAAVFVGAPGPLLVLFRDEDAERWAQVAPLVPVLLQFVAVYCLFESVSLIVSAALRGAGDTRFVSIVTLVFSWTLMVLPTVGARYAGWGLYAAWTFATGYLIVLSLVFAGRFRQGKWRTMRVIESAPLAGVPLEEIPGGQGEADDDHQPADKRLIHPPRPVGADESAGDGRDGHGHGKLPAPLPLNDKVDNGSRIDARR
jgi:MATE family multidrug resistance protein